MLLLRSHRANGSSPYDSQYKWVNEVGAKPTDPSWRPDDQYCGYGFHGLLNGEGDHAHLNWGRSQVWLVLEVDPVNDDVVHIQTIGTDRGKYKFNSAKILFIGTLKDAVTYLHSAMAARGMNIHDYEVNGAWRDEAIPLSTSNGGAGSKLKIKSGTTSKVGFRSMVDGETNTNVICTGSECYIALRDACTCLAENSSTIMGGNFLQALAGTDSLVVGSNTCTIGVHDRSYVFAGAGSTIKARNYCKLTIGQTSDIVLGHYSDLVCENDCTVSGKTWCKIRAGIGSKVKAGVGSNVSITAFDGEVITKYVRHLELDPYVLYKLDANKEFILA